MKQQFFHNNRLLLFAMVVLFALTPCKVKASLFETFGFTYEQTLNQSKVASSCTSSSFTAHKIVDFKATSTAAVRSNGVSFYLSKEEKIVVKPSVPKRIALQRPPKYILYKQFKFDVV